MFASGINKNVKKFAPKVAGRRKPGSGGGEGPTRVSTPTPTQILPSTPTPAPTPASIPSFEIQTTPAPAGQTPRESETLRRAPIANLSDQAATAAPSRPSIAPSTVTASPTVVEEADQDAAVTVGSIPQIRTTQSVGPLLLPEDQHETPHLTAPPSIRATEIGIPRIQLTVAPTIKATTAEEEDSEVEESSRKRRKISMSVEPEQAVADQEMEAEEVMGDGPDREDQDVPLIVEAPSEVADSTVIGSIIPGVEGAQPKEPTQSASVAAAKKTRKNSTLRKNAPRAKKAEATAIEGESAEGAQPSGTAEQPKKPRTPRRQRKPRANTTNATPEPSRSRAEASADAVASEREPNAPHPHRQRVSRHRSVTPPNAESIQIIPSVIKMSDLCRDIKTGKKSKRFEELEKIDWAEIVRKQRARKAEIDAAKATGQSIPLLETAEERIERIATENRPNAPPQRHAMQVRVVDGQIVLDEESLTIDRREHIEEVATELVEESSLTRRVNSATWGNREKAERWDEESTNKFYDALSMFGTDFEMISRLFSDRSRRQVKNKFNAEERRNPGRITQALKNRIAVDLQAYSEATATKYADPAILEEELESMRTQHAAEEAAAVEAVKELEKERREQADAELKAESGAVNGNGNDGLGGKRKRGKKGDTGNFISRHTGRGEVILGTI